MGRLDPQRDRSTAESQLVWILASRSPRRIELLRAAAQEFEIVPSEAAERLRDGEAPDGYALRVARDKASDVARRAAGRWILAADTVVVVDGGILGKPSDPEIARRMLSRLSGREHDVLTAFVLRDPAGRSLREEVVRSRVSFRRLSRAEIDRYVASGEPLDKAGAYAIQGGGREFVSRLEGSWTNVVGLPLDEVRDCLRAAHLWKENPSSRATSL
jgi:septum formation protein